MNKSPSSKTTPTANCFLIPSPKSPTDFNWLCHAYCLMDNHYHLVIETPDGNLSRASGERSGSIFKL